ncbi:hypothetical protein JTE90_012041 [Oedothorax gibbosus]|uniref:Uncharacterized protein n=1 Tax=Oedothorax gibbosus TaxID=931172 RepID=A0AAV6TPL2_9ARAC|nr:hypothetical protein JTE90_012041 [Oedothorax gibbosus]
MFSAPPRLSNVFFVSGLYYIWLYLFVLYFVPFVTLAVLNVFIWRASPTRTEGKEIRLATMLVSTSEANLARTISGFGFRIQITEFKFLL